MADAVQWAQCDRCEKWRVVLDSESLPDVWFCELNPDPVFNNCEIPEQQFPLPASQPLSNEAPDPFAAGQVPAQSPPLQSGSGRRGGRPLAPEVELENILKTWPTERLREVWVSFDWGSLVDAKRPPKPPKQPMVGGTRLDDRAFVSSLDATVRMSLPRALALQTPPMVSLWEQQQSLLRQLEQEKD